MDIQVIQTIFNSLVEDYQNHGDSECTAVSNAFAELKRTLKSCFASFEFASIEIDYEANRAYTCDHDQLYLSANFS